MSEDLKAKIWEWFAHLTVRRIGISVLALTAGMLLYTVWENREPIVKRLAVVTSDFKVVEPNKAQHELIESFMRSHPQVKIITLIDADPIANRRTVIHRFTLDDAIMTLFKKIEKEKPGYGDGPLFTDDQENNAQVLAITNGEFRCSKVLGPIQRLYPELAKDVKLSCRVPVPPAFRKAGGWFTMHLTTEEFDTQFKTDALTMSFQFFEAGK